MLNMADPTTIATIALLLDEEEHVDKKKRVKRDLWTRPWIKRREEEGCFHTLFQELKREDVQGFKEFIRLDKTHFEYVVEKLYHLLIKQDTVMRECIKPEEMCCLMLRYLASGESFRSLEF